MRDTEIEETKALVATMKRNRAKVKNTVSRTVDENVEEYLLAAMRRNPAIPFPDPHLGGWTRTSWNPDTGAVEITSIDASEIYL